MEQVSAARKNYVKRGTGDTGEKKKNKFTESELGASHRL